MFHKNNQTIAKHEDDALNRMLANREGDCEEWHNKFLDSSVYCTCDDKFLCDADCACACHRE